MRNWLTYEVRKRLTFVKISERGARFGVIVPSSGTTHKRNALLDVLQSLLISPNSSINPLSLPHTHTHTHSSPCSFHFLELTQLVPIKQFGCLSTCLSASAAVAPPPPLAISHRQSGKSVRDRERGREGGNGLHQEEGRCNTLTKLPLRAA